MTILSSRSRPALVNTRNCRERAELSAISSSSWLLEENFSISLPFLVDSRNRLQDITSNSSWVVLTTAIKMDSHIEISSRRIFSLIRTIFLKLQILDLLLQSRAEMEEATSTLSLVPSTTWPQKSTSNSHTRENLLIFSLQPSFCSSWLLNIHHLRLLSQMIHSTDAWLPTELTFSGEPTARTSQAKRPISVRSSKTLSSACSN